MECFITDSIDIKVIVLFKLVKKNSLPYMYDYIIEAWLLENVNYSEITIAKYILLLD